MSDNHSKGKAIKIMNFFANDNNSNSHKIHVEKDFLESIFTHKDVANRFIVVLSIVGAFRKGKSFFLNYCLRYLYGHYPSINYPDNPVLNPENWMGGEDEPLVGFSWKSGSTRDTSGIVMWNDVFLHTDEITGDNIAIILMDTQGLFDNETIPANNSKIFALSTLFSSIQIFNVFNIIHEDQLEYLEYATKYAEFACKEFDQDFRPFQDLWFLIRDWCHIDDHEWGFDGGKEYVENLLKIKYTKNSLLNDIRKNIKRTYETINGFLAPHPDEIVSTSVRGKEKYNGNWSDMDEDFKFHLSSMIEHLFDSKNLVLKKLNTEKIKAKAYFSFLLKIFENFESENLPQLSSISTAMIHQHFETIVDDCFEFYKLLLYDFEQDITETNVNGVFEKAESKTLLKFKETKKMNKNFEIMYEGILHQKIYDLNKSFKSSLSSDEEICEDVNKEFLLTMQAKQESKMREQKILKNIEKYKVKITYKQFERDKMNKQENKEWNEMLSQSEKIIEMLNEMLAKISKEKEYLDKVLAELNDKFREKENSDGSLVKKKKLFQFLAKKKLKKPSSN